MARRRGQRRDLLPVTSCDCARCRAACLESPGWFTPEQLAPLAAFLGKPLAEVFRRHLAIGVTAMPDGRLARGVMPHKLRDGKQPGSPWTLRELAVPGRCVFYDRGKCTIHPVRPFECARMSHDNRREAVRLRHRVVERWTRDALARFAAEVGGIGR